ncbi:MAG: CAP domain-containing protein [Thermoanaerobaculia bacterium]
MLSRINRDRATHGLPPVQMDPHASEVADRYCEQQIRNRTTGHFTTDGLTPYMRYAFSGGNDAVSENAAAWSANYDFVERVIPGIIAQAQEAMLAERPPDDGHRRTILDPWATHVGVGIAWHKGEFRLAQEFLRRYIHWDEAIPRTASQSDRVTVRGTPRTGFDVEAVSVHYDPAPTPMSASTASRIESYGLPQNRRDYRVARRNTPPEHLSAKAKLNYIAGNSEWPASTVRLSRDGSFSFTVPFREGDGVYTVVVWLRPAKGDAFAASNVAIRVTSPEPSAPTTLAGGAR